MFQSGQNKFSSVQQLFNRNFTNNLEKNNNNTDQLKNYPLVKSQDFNQGSQNILQQQNQDNQNSQKIFESQKKNGQKTLEQHEQLNILKSTSFTNNQQENQSQLQKCNNNKNSQSPKQNIQHLQRQLSSSYISQNSQISQLSQNYNRNKFSQTPQQQEESSIFHQQRKISPLTRERVLESHQVQDVQFYRAKTFLESQQIYLLYNHKQNHAKEKIIQVDTQNNQILIKEYSDSQKLEQTIQISQIHQIKLGIHDQHHKNKEQSKVNFQQINSKWLSIIQKPEIGYASANNNNKSLHQHQEDFDKNYHQNINQTISHINNNNNNNHKNNENNNILEIQANSYQQRNKFIKNLQFYIQQQQIKNNQIFSQISFDPKISELD